MFGDRRYYTTRATAGRSVKNVLFTLVMLFQVVFWLYVAAFVSTTKSITQDSLLEREIKDDPTHLDLQPGPPRMIKPVPIVNSVEDETNAKHIHAEGVENQPKIQVGYMKDLLQDLDGITDEKGKSLKEKEFDGNADEKSGSLKEKNLVDKSKEKSETIELTEIDYNKYYNSLLHHTILYREASIIWNNPFVLNPETICSRQGDLDLLVIVHTAPYNFRRRAMIRDQIANKRINTPFIVQPVFMIGSVKDEKKNGSEEAKIITEYKTYGDLVKMDFVEDFRNLSLKAVMWLKWTNQHCKNANMILKIDDDVVIDIQKILPLTRGLFSKYEKSIFCHLNRIGSQPIPRIGRTMVNPREFMRMLFYPYNYCSGFIVFLTPDIIPHLEKSARKIPFYNVDDVYMFGMVPKFVGGVTYHNIGYNVSIWNQKVLRCNVEKGSSCQYFGTMGEETVDRLNVWNAMKRNHQHDFHFPKLRVGF